MLSNLIPIFIALFVSTLLEKMFKGTTTIKTLFDLILNRA